MHYIAMKSRGSTHVPLLQDRELYVHYPLEERFCAEGSAWN